MLLLLPTWAVPVNAQTVVVEFVQVDVQPLVLPPTGGPLIVVVSAAADLDAAIVTFDLVPQDGGPTRTTAAHELSQSQPGVLGARLNVPIPDDLPSGWWSLRVRSVTGITNGQEVPARPGGTASDIFLVHPDRPVAGLPQTPWPQANGDAQHTGRTLAVGPSGVEVVRWRFVAQGRQPFHAPLVLADGQVAAVTWGGELYVLDDQGRPTTPSPFNAASAVAVAPAVGHDGNIIIVSEGGFVLGVRPTGTLAWRHQLGPGPAVSRPLSPPVVGPDGDVYVVHEPWSVTALTSEGDHLFTTELTPPEGLTVPVSRPPGPTEGPPLALATAGNILVASGSAVAVLGPNGTVTASIDCACAPRSISVSPEANVALIGAGDEVVAVSLAGAARLWSTRDRIGAFQGQLWQAPAVDWQGVTYFPTEAGRIYAFKITSEGSHVWTRSLGQPIRGALTVDGEGNLYFADACRLLRSWRANAASRWTFEMDSPSCNGLTNSVVLDRSGAIIWASPDGAITVLGSNRLPIASFAYRWDGDAHVFDASSSRDPDGSPLSYAWDLGGGATAQGAIVRHRFASSGPATVTLTVGDGTGSSTSSVTLDVNFPPTPVVIDRSEGYGLLLDASNTVDPEGDPIDFAWTLDDEPAGNGSILSLNASEPRVRRAVLTASDPSNSARQEVVLLAPSRSQWTGVTLALFPGACPSGICASPEALTVIENTLLEVRLINGAGRRVQVTTTMEAVAGGVDSTELDVGQQAILHLQVGASGTRTIELSPTGATGLPPTPFTLSVRPAPAQVVWKLDTPDDALVRGRTTDLLIHLDGPAPPGDATVRLALRVGLEDV
ncbi:MAG TPA: PKD domain-containing protein, partial [Nitriliruptorales bacterium]